MKAKRLKRVELYKALRPKSLDEIVGNRETVQCLQKMLKKGTVPHSLLFSGPSGCGKTTLARILREDLGCSPMDFSEVNASSSRGIDTVRDIIRTMSLAPNQGTCRIWLLDECHQMSKDAQEAMLKMLEDTPRHVYFFLSTTHPQKLIPQIRTRCTDFPVALLTTEELTSLAALAVRSESLDVPPAVIAGVVAASQGSARRCLVLLDKIRNLPPEEQEAAIESQTEQENEAIDLCRALIKKTRWKEIAEILRGLQEADPESIRWAVLGYARVVLLGGGRDAPQAHNIITCFEDNFYDSKAAGLARAAFEATL